MKEIKVKIGFTPSQRQSEIITCFLEDDTVDEVVVCCGRQVGKTTLSMYAALVLLLTKTGYKVGYFMPTYKQCKKVFNQFVKVFKPLKHVKINKSDLIIEFPNGSELQFFTAENDNCRGFTFHSIIIDEACFVKDEIYQAAIIGTVAVSLSNKTGKQLIVSTPKARNWFYDSVYKIKKGRKVFRFTTEEGGIISKEVLEGIKSSIPTHLYNNEYMGEFADEGTGLFQYNECVLTPTDLQGVIAGLDFGIKDDSTVLTVLNKHGQMIVCKSWVNKDWQDILKEVKTELVKHGSPIVYCETNGIGQMPYTELKKIYSNARSWITSAKSKTDIINSLSTAFVNKSITILPIDEVKVQLDAYSMNYDPKTGKMTFGARSGFHDDIVMSLAIANWNRNTGQLMVTRYDNSNNRR